MTTEPKIKMDFKRFNQCIDALNKYDLQERNLSVSLNPFTDGYSIVVEFCPEIVTCLFNLIEDAFNDVNKNFIYWYYDQEQGARANKYYITEANGKKVKNRTREDIYNYLIKESK